VSAIDENVRTSTVDGIPTREELVARAIALRPLVREHAPATEADRRLADEVSDALTEAGLFRMLTPKRHGGYETDLRTVLEVTEALGEADGSTSWLVAVGSVAGWISCLASEEAQKDIFGADPDARIAGGNAPISATRVEGGLRVSGRWSYASGSHHATWASLGAAVVDDTGQIVDAILGLVPVSEISLEETWQTIGMRGTGSNTWVVEDVFIPQHRVISMAAMAEGEWPVPTGEALYRTPFVPLATLPLVGPLLGLGRAALEYTISKTPRPMHHTFFAHQADSVGVQIQIAEAALKLETARLHVYSVADEIDGSTAAGEEIGYAGRARIRAQAGYAAQQILEAITVLVNVHGASSFAESSPMQQLWRDANTAARHAGLNSVVGYEIYGKSLLGVEERISPMV
jgi:3-hydroxy-9,10-secoandrosta-1,3,5(10)-triene-9,17-dione monooxygenase